MVGDDMKPDGFRYATRCSPSYYLQNKRQRAAALDFLEIVLDRQLEIDRKIAFWPVVP